MFADNNDDWPKNTTMLPAHSGTKVLRKWKAILIFCLVQLKVLEYSLATFFVSEKIEKLLDSKPDIKKGIITYDFPEFYLEKHLDKHIYTIHIKYHLIGFQSLWKLLLYFSLI